MENYDNYDYEYIEGTPWRAGYYHVWDGLHDAYGATLDQAIDELHRNMGIKPKEATMKQRRIITTYEYPPIPSRAWDWSAVRDGYEPDDPIGRGSTENAAIRDLLDQEVAGEGA